MNVALRQVLAKPMTLVTSSPVQPHTYPSTLRHGSATTSERQNTFPTCFYFILLVMEAEEGGKPRMQAALGWRCASGERVHSPTHPFPVLSRSIIVERWRWEPRSLPTPTPAAPPYAADKQPLTSAVYASIYTFTHTSIHSSIENKVILYVWNLCHWCKLLKATAPRVLILEGFT